MDNHLKLVIDESVYHIIWFGSRLAQKFDQLCRNQNIDSEMTEICQNWTG
jgi:hypothetical protein